MDVEKLKKNKSALKASTTKLLNKIEQILNSENIDDLELYLEQLEEKFTNLKVVNKELLAVLDSKEIENETEKAEEYNENIIAYRHKINKKIKELKNKNGNSEIISSTNPNSNGNNLSDINSIRLPKISISRFYGQPEQFLEFISQFENAIDKNKNLSKVEKLIYLKSYLGGIAAKTISGFALNDSNYDSALDLLKQRFGQTNLLINAHLGALLNIQNVKNVNDTYKLRKLLNTAETEIRNLQSLGIDPNSYTNLLTPILLKAIPSELCLEFNRKNTSDTYELKNLLNFLQEEITARERSNNVIAQFGNETKEKIVDRKSRESSFKKSSAHQLLINVKKCIFCKNDHDSVNCTVLSIDEKRELLKREGRCYLCLLVSHRISECNKKIKCSHCNGKHSVALCYKLHLKKENDKKFNNNESNIVTAISSCGSNENTKNSVFLQTASVNISHNGFVESGRILFDCGSMRSFILKEKSRKLRLPIVRKENLTVFSFGDKTPIQKVFNVVKVKLENEHNSSSSLELELLEIEDISTAHIPPPDLNLLRKNKFLKNLHLADFSCRKKTQPISILIGADYYFSAVTGKIKRINKDLVASETLFGWCLLGKNYSHNSEILSMKIVVQESEIANQMKKFWELESLGITSEDEQLDPLNCDVMKHFESQIKFENSRYIVRLPWKTGKKHLLSNNKEVAEQRFLKLKKQFQKNPDYFVNYQNVLQDYLQQNIIELVTDDCNKEKQITFYLPHRAIIRENKSTKYRIVFDGSAHGANELSLNDCLHVGPNLYPDIFDLLLKFRLHPVAFTADLKQAFLQIVVDERDRDVSRFLFTDNPHDNSTPPICYRFTRVLFGLSCSPFLLCATIKHHLKQYEISHPETCDFLNNNLYVDDVIGGHQDVEHALRTSLECIRIFEDAGMIVHKWQTNSKKLEDAWVKEGIVSNESLKTSDSLDLPHKVLGICWDRKNDVLFFDIENLLVFLSKNVNTKRFLLQAVGRIFDPVGFLSPFILRVKLMIQEIWQRALDWDEELPPNLTVKWKKWCSEVPNIHDFKIPRYYLLNFESVESTFEFHFFSDASQKAFSTVTYLRIISSTGLIRTVFVASKTRVAPLKLLTLPRLELMAALLSAKLSVRVLKALKLNSTCYFWADSTIALFWIKNNSNEFKPFVKNRVDEIKKLTKPKDWYFCPGKQNPADIASRGTGISDLKNSKIWLEGPEWLSMTSEAWPTQEKISVTDPHIVEYRKNTTKIQQHLCISEEKLLNVLNYSNLTKLLRVTAWVIRFVYNLKNSVKRKGNLSSEELKESEVFWIKCIQNEHYNTEIMNLSRNEKIKPSSKIFNLSPFVDSKGTLRIKTRLQESNFTFDEKQPVLLPHSYFSKLLVKHEHENVMHCGIAITLMNIRKKFWIPKGRQFVKKVINECIICRKFSARPANQITAQLPKDRICITPPFEVCGTDFAGPIYVRHEHNNKKTQKSYIALFTCAVTRAVHLELVTSMSTKCYLLALRRFLARRGNCSIMYSDNAKAFKNADKEMQFFSKILKDKRLQDFISSKGVTWKFIVERAPWWGGFYERLVKSVKEPLRKILGRALLNYEELATILTEIETVLNSRPLTYVDDNPEEPTPLTPAHFLCFGKKNFDYPVHFLQLENKISTKESLIRRKLYQTTLLSQLWQKWKNLYLMNLRTAHNFKVPVPHNNLKIGDIVLVDGTSKSKLLWNLGIVKEILTGRDGFVRACLVKVKGKLFRKPVQLLYPLEIQ